MNVKLIGCTQPVDLNLINQGIEDVQELIAYCARVSNPDNQINTETSEKLLRYLIKHQHWSPLEMAHVTMEIKTTRDIARQILRHRSFAFQEFSQRYANPTESLGFVIREARYQDTKNRQNSIKIEDEAGLSLAEEWEEKQQAVIDLAKETYQWAIDNNFAKEQARAVLPEGNTVSCMYMAGSIRSWIHYIELRASNGTQQEHMDIAVECAKAITQVFPMASTI